jgi:predicted PurR-regulated permease PerM
MKGNLKDLKNNMPGYAKYFYILASLVLTVYIIILSRSVFNPLLAALIMGILLTPMASHLERFKIPRALSTTLAILVVFIVLSGLSWFFSGQIANIASDMDTIEAKTTNLIDQATAFIENRFGLQPTEQTNYLKDGLNTFLKNSTSFFGSTISATAGFFSGFFLFLIALFFFLYYRSFLVSFLYQLFESENHGRLGHTLTGIRKVVKDYILGLFLVILIIAVLNTIGLMALGIEHAIFFGVLAAVLTIIPYIGIFIGSVLPILFALVTKDSLWYPIGVLLVFWFIQTLEGNFITPNIMGSQLSINPFAAILGLFIGGMILGTLGMIFAIPLLAICKVIFDANESTKPLGYLIGSPPEDHPHERKKRGLWGKLFHKGESKEKDSQRDSEL